VSAPRGACLPFPPGIGEDAWRKEAENIGRELGWLVAHVERSRPRPGQWITNTVAGFPDSWFAWPAGGLLVVEFKSARGKATPEQVAWILALGRTEGVTARVLGPDDWPVLQDLLTSVHHPRASVTALPTEPTKE
jgi:hypothetical protein